MDPLASPILSLFFKFKKINYPVWIELGEFTMLIEHIG
jgi:hypothetical protein